jgi:hypothetical protein
MTMNIYVQELFAQCCSFYGCGTAQEPDNPAKYLYKEK